MLDKFGENILIERMFRMARVQRVDPSRYVLERTDAIVVTVINMESITQ